MFAKKPTAPIANIDAKFEALENRIKVLSLAMDNHLADVKETVSAILNRMPDYNTSNDILNDNFEPTILHDVLSFDPNCPEKVNSGGYIFMILFVSENNIPATYVGYSRNPKKRISTLLSENKTFNGGLVLFSQHFDDVADVFKALDQELSEMDFKICQNIYKFEDDIVDIFFDFYGDDATRCF